MDSTSLPACSSSGHEVGDRLVLGIEVEQDAHVAELERAIDEDDLLAQFRGGGDRHVHRDRRASDAALGAEQRDDQARLAAGVRPDRARGLGRGRDGEPTGLLPFAGVDLADRGGQLVAAEGLDEELAGPRQHRAAEVVRLALDRHHHDRCGRHGPTEQLRGGDPVHVRHVDVHQHDIGREGRREGDRFRAGRRRADHIDVALEAKQLREVIAGLRDVVDDEDADLVCHQAVWLSFLAGADDG